MIQHKFPLYKGLQKPLTYRGFKGKYIYWGLASLFLGLIIGSIFASIASIFLAAFAALCTMALGLCYTLLKQKKGLFNKRVDKGIFIHQSSAKFNYEKSPKNNI